MTEDVRITAIRIWLENDLKLQIKQFVPASSDASFRRYFRVTHQYGTHIIMDAPPDRENIPAFIQMADILSQANINVPQILQQNLTQGFLLLQDFGDCSYLHILNADNSTPLYQAAMHSLLNMQLNIDIQTHTLAHYNEKLLRTELGIFEQWFLTHYADIEVTTELQSMFEKTWKILIDNALEQPEVFVHRDFHSRNLMYLTDNNPGILDFQDAVTGPITYDLVSLLRDCYISWSEAEIEHWLTCYWQALQDHQLLKADVDLALFRRWFDLMGMQRHLKAIGIFTRLKYRDKKDNYMQDIPRTLQYVHTISARYPELNTFGQFLQQINAREAVTL